MQTQNSDSQHIARQNKPHDTPVMNGKVTARPNTAAADGEALDFNDMKMTAQDAIESGYMDEQGHAISKARKDVPGSPTGAYTDIGAGRSSVVHHSQKIESSAPKVGEEQVP